MNQFPTTTTHINHYPLPSPPLPVFVYNTVYSIAFSTTPVFVSKSTKHCARLLHSLRKPNLMAACERRSRREIKRITLFLHSSRPFRYKIQKRY
ncbi:hypothetical protein L2E82_02053 [Cichorium intybus]|uniref:Uncharacterized protein n=1 Tax=Cichorium intybus TaxID=13427 RepID=A0ACB9H189_CICIN|nr:hypothetical protein L2E82_02053 [Cichorium intybus]